MIEKEDGSVRGYNSGIEWEEIQIQMRKYCIVFFKGQYNKREEEITFIQFGSIGVEGC